MGETILGIILGGLGGTFGTIFYNRYNNRIQKMHCYCIDEDIMSKLPITNDDGTTHQNIYTKEFLLKNTTNSDQKDFRVIFEFDVGAIILKHTNKSKVGTDTFSKRLPKENEYSVRIKDFNRGDEVKFIFEIANITDNHINITEANCIGFKIVHKDKRKSKANSKLTFVSKEVLNPDT
ncbi:hypothetical protein [Winogradskyella sp. SYSU M77433]|uniref:hypothetical protein n=1 Tax=Winogradskyella sp. SYSU M77433 TaxID=3042722 RepID=UPI00248059ED|nr:hypothetical protein [Winogradskyella sp. SYSU M77433]MDH7912591.1 hypothetical protein [Winogradskyella sp. SYSU M77433]